MLTDEHLNMHFISLSCHFAIINIRITRYSISYFRHLNPQELSLHISGDIMSFSFYLSVVLCDSTVIGAVTESPNLHCAAAMDSPLYAGS